ncbi:beta-galactosidase-like protein [Cereibacter ovatus]|uniref:Beta-galactosidase-like protein n=1 Tax=Cereibacter ovatus TaxID=439529 RepID=A0A285CVQ9_9RHOB|nr:beta-galactosidase [Cereibacter ovatus]SNX71116.1 beta-galactosidase-like protein [Cereibacter ovatus]
MRLRSLVAAALVTLSAGGATADTIDLSQVVASPNPRLGLAFPGSNPKHYSAIAQAGIGVVRLSVAWDRVEPAPGRFDWSGLDSRVVGLQAYGIEPFLTFESTADWGTVPETRGVKNARPNNPADWERFVRAVVERYDGDGHADAPGLHRRVRYWQAANEWISDKNKSGGWVGTTDELIDYIRRTHDAVKAVDPRAIFVLGGIAAFNLDVLLVARGGQQFTVRQKWNERSETVLSPSDMRGAEIARIIDRDVLPVLRQSPYDIADVHLYGPESRDAARIAMIGSMTGRPVLSAECGGPSLDYGDRYTPEGHFIAVVDRNLGVLAAGGQFCLWYRLGEGRDTTFGNRHTALYTERAKPKPGVYAYRMLSRLLAADTTVRAAGPALFELRRTAGDVVRIGWGGGAAAVRAFAAQTGAQAYCLADAGTGALSRDPGRCDPEALTVAGHDLSSLLSR